MKNAKSIILTIAAIVCSFSGVVAAKGEQGSGPSPYVECGIGAALFSNTSWAAVSSNVIWDLGLTALSSATSSPEMCNAKKVKAAMFIRDTYPNIVEETASGQGEHLIALLQIFECSNDSHAQIIQSVRSKVGAQVASEGYSSLSHLDKAAQYYNAINDTVENDFSTSCAA
ncbi:MAG: DUF3015 family protein [Porticoccus sp.]|nr:DUF3015 family protein [Porticoccus sp.]MBQ0806949.1 DUF3015 family protein [Porticoccus sp.]